MTAVTPNTKRWKELVRLGIARDGQRNWFLGDAALEIFPFNTSLTRPGWERESADADRERVASLRRYADEIGVAYHTLMDYRRVAHHWPSSRRVQGVSWKVHDMLATRQELMQPGMTVSRAAQVLGHQNVGRTGPEADAASKAEVVRSFLQDPEVAALSLSSGVADTLMEDGETRAALLRAAERRAAQLTKAKDEEDARHLSSSRSSLAVSVGGELARARDGLTAAKTLLRIADSGVLDPDMRDYIARRVRPLEQLLGDVRILAGIGDWDKAFQGEGEFPS